VLKLTECCLIISHSKPNRKIKNKKCFSSGSSSWCYSRSANCYVRKQHVYAVDEQQRRK